MPNIRIKVGAAVDANMGATIFKPIVEGAKRARAQVNQELGKVANNGPGGPYRSRAERDPQLAAIKQRTQDIKAANREIERDMRRSAAEQRKIAGEMQRMLNREQRIADRAALRVSGGSVRAVGGAVRGAMGVAGDLARGAGVDFSLGNSLKQRMALETGAVGLSNSGYMKGDARNGTRVDPRALMKQAQEVGIANASAPNDVMAGMSAFVSKTGDLQTARDVIGDMAKLAKATGTNMEDMVSAAGDISANLGDIPDKGAAIAEVMRQAVGQGKMGAVEIKDNAKQMAKIAAAASLVGGDRKDAFAQMGALQQMSRARGGSASAQQASTSVQAFVATFDKGAREKQFKAHGVQTRNKDGTLRSPEEVITDALKSTKGDSLEMGKMFADTRARSATKGFESVFREASGGKKDDASVAKGLAAVKAEFAKLTTGAKIGGEELDASHAAAMSTGASKAAVLKAKIEKDLGDALEKAAPKLEKLGEYAGLLVEKFGGMVEWASANPFEAVAAALSLSMMKSMGGEVMRAGFEKMMGTMASRVALAGAGPGLPQGGKLAEIGGPLGAFSAALGVATAAVAAYTAGTIAIDQAFREKEKKQNAVAMSGADAAGALGELKQARARRAQAEKSDIFALPQAQADVEAAEAKVRASIAKLTEDKKTNDTSMMGFGQGLARAGAEIFGGDEGREAVKTQIQTINKQSDAMAAQIRELTAALTGGTLRVEVVNQPAAGPTAPTAGRTPR